MSFNVILFTDTPNPDNFTRGYGAYRIASEIRQLGYTVLTVDFCSAISIPMFMDIINKSIGEDTLLVGFSSTWFPYRQRDVKNDRFIIGQKSLLTDPRIDFDAEKQEWYHESISYKISQDGLPTLVAEIKKLNPKTKVIMGGGKANEYVTESCLDNVFIGYSENQIKDYLNSLSGKGPKRIFNKIIDYDIKGELGDFDIRTSITGYVETDCLLSEELLTIEFSRGCIFNCSFCSMAHRNQDTRDFIKYQETIRTELMDNWTKWGIYKYVIIDDTFNDHTEKLILINEVIQSLPFKPVFVWAYCRIDLISRDPRQAQLMKDIGVKEVYYGLETWNDKTAKAIKKGGSKSKKVEGMRIAKECWGDEVWLDAGIVIGLPYETIESVQESVDWYIAEGHKYIDNLKYVTLTVRSNIESLKYQFLSDIEKDPAGWGYIFQDPVNDPFNWTRLNDTDITGRDQANEIMTKSNSLVKPYHNKNKKGMWMDIYKSYDINADLKSPSELFVSHVRNIYWPKLINVLSKS